VQETIIINLIIIINNNNKTTLSLEKGQKTNRQLIRVNNIRYSQLSNIIGQFCVSSGYFWSFIGHDKVAEILSHAKHRFSTWTTSMRVHRCTGDSNRPTTGKRVYEIFRLQYPALHCCEWLYI